MNTTLKNSFQLIKATFQEWQEDRASRLSAALAYYTIFSIPPLLIIALVIAGQLFDRQAASDELIRQISGLIGQDGAGMVETMLENASQPADTFIASIIGVITLLLGATGVFGELQGALNTIWEVAPKPGRGFWGTIKDRFLSFTMVLGVGFLLLVSLIISTGLAALHNFLTGGAEEVSVFLQVLNFLISFSVIAIMFTLIFKYVPDVEVAWRDVWLGGVVTAFLFTVGKFAIGLYLGNGGVASAYGPAGALVIVLLWVYYSTQILFLGAEFTQVYANQYGSHVRPAADAISLTETQRAQQGIPHQETVERKAQLSEAKTTPYRFGRSVGTTAVPSTRLFPSHPHIQATRAGINAVFYYISTSVAVLVGVFYLWYRRIFAGSEQ